MFQLTQHLFQDANGTNSNVGNFGMDLMALNVQRGRDHGIPPYHEYRKLCGLPAIRNWRQLSSIVAAPEVHVFCIVIARSLLSEVASEHKNHSNFNSICLGDM